MLLFGHIRTIITIERQDFRLFKLNRNPLFYEFMPDGSRKIV